ncbi:MAG: TIGR02206 family membrane protein [Planctomycetota bacterium]
MFIIGSFVLFSTEHSAALLAIALVGAGLSVLTRTRVSQRRRVCYCVAAVTVAGTLFEQTGKIVTGHWVAQDSLPLHLCDIAVFVSAGALVAAVTATAHPRANDRLHKSGRASILYELTYYWALGATLQALLTPDLDVPYPRPEWFRYFVTHGGIVIGVLVMTFGLGMRPRASSLIRVWLLTLGLAVAVLGINWLIGSNYMFLCQPPGNASLIDYLGPWPWYLLSLVGVGTAEILVCFSPWWLLDHRCGERLSHGRCRD